MEHSSLDVHSCKICNSRTVPLFDVVVMERIPARLLRCTECGFSAFYDPTWVNESYENPLTSRDCGAVRRCILMAARFALFAHIAGRQRMRWLDFGGNTGLLARLLRDYGIDAGSTDKYERNIFCNGFAPDSPAVVSLVEVIEHLEDPVGAIGEIALTMNPDFMVFATQLIPEVGIDSAWWYLQLDTGQHISFFTIRSLKLLADRFEYGLATCGSLMILYRKKGWNSAICAAYRFLLAIGVPYVLNGLYPLVSRKWINKDYLTASGKAE